jgi:hypothetical protein
MVQVFCAVGPSNTVRRHDVVHRRGVPGRPTINTPSDSLSLLASLLKALHNCRGCHEIVICCTDAVNDSSAPGLLTPSVLCTPDVHLS